MRNIYSALDIGSYTIKLVVGEFINNKLNILCAEKVYSHGFKNNVITDEERLIKAINECVSRVNEKLNFRVKKVLLNIPCEFNEFDIAEASIDIDEEIGRVSSDDIASVLKIVSENKIKANNELVCNHPAIFKVGDEETKEPYNKRGNSLAVKSVLVSTEKRRVYDLIKLVSKCGLEVLDIMPAGMPDYFNFETKELNEKNVIMVNIGSTSTNIGIFNKGIYINNAVLDIGGYDIDKEISIIYNLRKTETLYVKESFSLASARNAKQKEIVLVPNREGNEIEINQLEISKIMERLVTDFLKNIKNTINNLTKKQISYIIITGGLSELEDISIPIREVFDNKGKIGKINNLGARDNSYSSSIGLLKYFNNKMNLRNKDYMSITNEDLNSMLSGKTKSSDGSLLGKFVNYFFDNN